MNLARYPSRWAPLLVGCLLSAAPATGQLLILEQSGTTQANSFFDGNPIAAGTAFSYAAAFDPTADLEGNAGSGRFRASGLFAIEGLGVFEVDSFGSDFFVELRVSANEVGGLDFAAGIADDLGNFFQSIYTSASPVLDADAPGVSALSGQIGVGANGFVNINLDSPSASGALDLAVQSFADTAQISAYVAPTGPSDPRIVQIAGQVDTRFNLQSLDPVPGDFPVQVGDPFNIAFTLPGQQTDLDVDLLLQLEGVGLPLLLTGLYAIDGLGLDVGPFSYQTAGGLIAVVQTDGTNGALSLFREEELFGVDVDPATQVINGYSFNPTFSDDGRIVIGIPGLTTDSLADAIALLEADPGAAVISANLEFTGPGNTEFGVTGAATVTIVPEPASLVLLGMGGLVLAARRRSAAE